jgi:hypothetical protein
MGWFSLVIAVASALLILFDIFGRGHRQKMAIMEAVYPATALYWGPVALWFYYRHGRRDAVDNRAQNEEPPRRVVLFKAVCHCGAGCTLGDIAGEWLVAALGLMVAGKSLYADIPMDFAWAWSLGIVFQYFSIVPMRDQIGRVEGIWAAIKADTFSILAFQLGLFAGMAIYQLLIWSEPLPKSTATYWMMMQLSMILGFFTAMPVNAWLVRKGWKEKM